MASIYPTGTVPNVPTYTTGTTYLGGGATNYSAGTQYIGGGSQARYNGAGTTTTYVSGPTYVTGGSAVRQAVGVPTTSYVTGGSYYGAGTTTTATHLQGGLQGGYIGGSVARRPVTEEIPVESRIEYIPFETKHIEYDQVERVERIPYEREIV